MPDPPFHRVRTCECEIPSCGWDRLLYLPGGLALALDMEWAGKSLLFLFYCFLVHAFVIETRIKKLVFNGSVITLVKGGKLKTRGSNPHVFNADLDVMIDDFAWRLAGARIQVWDGSRWHTVSRGKPNGVLLNWFRDQGLEVHRNA